MITIRALKYVILKFLVQNISGFETDIFKPRNTLKPVTQAHE